MKYIKLSFSEITEEQTQILIALLSEHQYIGFEEVLSGGLSAYIAEDDFDKQLIEEIAINIKVRFIISKEEEKNWNEVWEANFPPVVVDDFVAIRAHFHEPLKDVQHEIVITPKMSFGTGHHATTYMMIQRMREIDFSDKTVLDFGTGTGILAILSEKLGAKWIVALDNDDWSINNAKENIKKNECKKITVFKNDGPTNGYFDIILANINKNIILDHLPRLKRQLTESGFLLLSGILAEDEKAVMEKSKELGFNNTITVKREHWISLLMNG
jgi:ribosomal protein L11 methyltransferase